MLSLVRLRFVFYLSSSPMIDERNPFSPTNVLKGDEEGTGTALGTIAPRGVLRGRQLLMDAAGDIHPAGHIWAHPHQYLEDHTPLGQGIQCSEIAFSLGAVVGFEVDVMHTAFPGASEPQNLLSFTLVPTADGLSDPMGNVLRTCSQRSSRVGWL